MDKLLVITGPTATGKTALGIELAKKFDGEIISADSRQVYRGNDEETGKDHSYPQWGIDIAKPGEDFSVSSFVDFAQKMIADIVARNKLPIIVGGTGLYIKELLIPSETLNIPMDTSLREKLDSYTLEHLQQELIKISPQKWQSMNVSDQKNPRRLIRAIEVVLTPIRDSGRSQNDGRDILMIGLTGSREIIYQNIVARRKTRPDLVEKEFKLAKKQLLYMQKYLQPIWFDVTSPSCREEIFSTVTKWYTRINDSQATHQSQ